MLAIVKKPCIEQCLNRADCNKSEKDDTPVDILETDYWKTVTSGSLLAGTRLKHGLTQKRLAALAGMSHATISAYETGKQPLSRRSAVRLAKVMDEDPDSFFENLR